MVFCVVSGHDIRRENIQSPTDSTPTLWPPFGHRIVEKRQSAAGIVQHEMWGQGRASDLVAEVIPEGGHSLVHAIGGTGLEEWRFSRSGMTYLASHKDWSIRLDVPDAENVFVEWFRQHGWSVALSSAGRIAKQICLALGGLWGIHILANEGIVKLLQKMSNGRAMKKQAFLGEISRLARLERFPVPAERLLKAVTSHRMVRLGVEVQCPVCTQHSWYSLEDMNYRLQCMKCLERFDVSSHSPDELAWCYRSFGPFSLPAYAHGAYAVLLTYYFFPDYHSSQA